MDGMPYLVPLAIILGCLVPHTLPQANTYALDRQSTCGKEITVYEAELTLTARSNVAPANPPLECIVYLQSAFEVADGRYRLQIIVEQLQIEDCSVSLAIFNGRGYTGNYLRQLGCSSGSTDIIYTTGRQATVRFSRPQTLYQTAYAVTLTIKTYADGNEIGTAVGLDKLSTGAIIGIVVGLVVLIALAIILCWCCCTGYIHNFIHPGEKTWGGGRGTRAGVGVSGAPYTKGSVDSNLEKMSTTSSTQQLKNGINYDDPAVWSSLTGLNDGNNRNFRQGMPRKAAGRVNDTNSNVEMRSRMERDTYRGQNYENSGRRQDGPTGQRDSHAYEPYDAEADRSPRFRKRQDNQGGSNRSRGSRRSRNSAAGGEGGEGEGGGGKETVIDDPGTGSTDDDSLQKPPLEDTTDDEESKLNRFESEADVDTIASTMHLNAGVRSSIPDLSGPHRSPSHSPRAKKRSSTSPKSRKKHRGQGQEPDPMALPPEAFDPVFTTPTSQEQYPGEFRPAQQQFMPPMPFAPYGMYPMVPGQQTYAYAYQQMPQYAGGTHPANQGAYFVQSVPTADGDMQNTAFAMQSTRTPKRKGSKGKGGGGGGLGHPGAPDYTSTPGASPRPGTHPSSPPDMALIAAGVAPPDPGPGHRSMAMKSFADPDTGMQTTQVLWTDNVPDPTDPGPEDNSQVTRKTTTRVTTRSGKGDLPTQTHTMLDYQDPNPAFLAPSTPQQPLHNRAAITPNTTNVDYYMGQGAGSAPVRALDVVHSGPSRNNAIRDRVTLRDSTA
ncbi:uncharacterized protein [Littorina saxatilis]|uniref:CUB domain-containing protein n=1 Tax=Littorina saxatilis TaxID=31220 RepID=A0AAN9BDW9_9CAEN